MNRTADFKKLNGQYMYDMIDWFATEHTPKGEIHGDTDTELLAAVRASKRDFSKVDEYGEEYWVHYKSVKEGREKLIKELKFYIDICQELKEIPNNLTLTEIIDLFEEFNIVEMNRKVVEKQKRIDELKQCIKDERKELKKLQRKLNKK